MALPPSVDPLLSVGTARRVPRVENTDDKETAADGHNCTGALKHIISSLLGDLFYTTTWCYLTYITNVRSPPPCREKSVQASEQHWPPSVEQYRWRQFMQGPTSFIHRRTTPAGARGIIDAAPTSLGGRNPGENKNLGAASSKENNNNDRG